MGCRCKRGYYTRKLADRVPGLRVFAFEPSPANFERLQSACTDLPNIDCLQVGLSAATGTIRFIQGTDELGATSRLARASERASSSIDVEVCSGDDLIAGGRVQAPNVIKIDVEGHELEVLKGLTKALANPALRACVLEVHFGLLAQSGAPDAPATIARLLEGTGFRLRWIDASHLNASRAGTRK